MNEQVPSDDRTAAVDECYGVEQITKDTQLDELMRICSDADCKSKGTYQITATCPNCGWRGGVTLTRGHRFQGFSTDCPRCACAGLMRV